MWRSYDPIFIKNGTTAKMKARCGLERNNPVPGIRHCLNSAHNTPTSGEIPRTVNTSRNKALRTVRIWSLRRCNWNKMQYLFNIKILVLYMNLLFHPSWRSWRVSRAFEASVGINTSLSGGTIMSACGALIDIQTVPIGVWPSSFRAAITEILRK